MRKIGIFLAVFAMLSIAGCNEKDTSLPNNSLAFGDKKGVAEGTADFATETPNINLKNISAYVGEEIDYSTYVDVTNTDKYDDFQMWVDASAVDIYTEGVYEAVYRFVYDGKSMEKKVVVSVVQKSGTADEPSGDETANSGDSVNSSAEGEKSTTGTMVIPSENNNGAGGNTDNGQNPTQNGEVSNNGQNPTQSVGVSNNGQNPTQSGGVSNNGQNPTQSGGVSNNGQNPTQNGGVSNNGQKPTSSGGNSNNGQKPTSNGGTSNETSTAHRQIITSSGQNDTKSYTIGYMNIELLSGSVVKIKCTSSKYIVSTRTDISSVTKKGVNYNVYKLIITYNTGAEQTLETYEEKAVK